MAFRPGQSGNPRGRPRGALGAAGKIRKQLEEAAGPIVQKLLDRAAKGEPASMRLVLERLCPLVLPADPVEAAQAVLTRLAAGMLTLDEGEVLLGGIKTVQAISVATQTPTCVAAGIWRILARLACAPTLMRLQKQT